MNEKFFIPVRLSIRSSDTQILHTMPNFRWSMVNLLEPVLIFLLFGFFFSYDTLPNDKSDSLC